MKGFVFTIETLITVIILLFSLLLLNTFFLENFQNDLLLTTTQSNTMNSFYYNKNNIFATNSEIIYCFERIIYNTDTNNFVRKNVCEGT